MKTTTLRLPDEVMDQVDEIVRALYACKNTILTKCVEYGLELFKKDRPELFKAVEEGKKKEEKKK